MTSDNPEKIAGLKRSLDLFLDQRNEIQAHVDANHDHLYADPELFQKLRINQRNHELQDQLDEEMAFRDAQLKKDIASGKTVIKASNANPFSRRECKPKNMWDMVSHHVRGVEVLINLKY
jgi:hypothetical protein